MSGHLEKRENEEEKEYLTNLLEVHRHGVVMGVQNLGGGEKTAQASLFVKETAP